MKIPARVLGGLTGAGLAIAGAHASSPEFLRHIGEEQIITANMKAGLAEHAKEIDSEFGLGCIQAIMDHYAGLDMPDYQCVSSDGESVSIHEAGRFRKNGELVEDQESKVRWMVMRGRLHGAMTVGFAGITFLGGFSLVGAVRRRFGLLPAFENAAIEAMEGEDSPANTEFIREP